MQFTHPDSHPVFKSEYLDGMVFKNNFTYRRAKKLFPLGHRYGYRFERSALSQGKTEWFSRTYDTAGETLKPLLSDGAKLPNESRTSGLSEGFAFDPANYANNIHKSIPTSIPEGE